MVHESNLDLFEIEIIKNTLTAIGEEMFAAQRRSSMSPIIYESLDFGVGIIDARGRLISQGCGIPGFIGTLDSAVQTVAEKYRDKIHAGDVFATNDPYSGGGTHLSDVTLVMPVFFSGVLVAWTANKAHWTEVGGKDPGSFCADSTEVFQEGLQLPAIKIIEAGIPHEGTLEILAANVRMPRMTLGDFWSGVAALRVGERRIMSLVEKYGVANIELAIEKMLDHGAALVTEGFRRLPKGVFSAEDWIDEDGLGNGPFRICVTVTVTDEEFIVDYTGSDLQAPGPVNNTEAGLISAVRQVYMSLTDPSVIATDGCFRRIKVICPEGTICRARRPAPVSSYFETAIVTTDIVWKALADHMPHAVPAGQFGSICSTVIAGIHPVTGESFVFVEPLVGGWGGGPDKDGESGQFSVGNGETHNVPVEIAEARYGLLVTRYELDLVDGGAGQFRGGRGVVRDYRILGKDAYLTTMFGRAKTAPWPVNGGSPGTCNYVQIHHEDGTVGPRFGKVGRLPLQPGDTVRLVTGSGAGWGPPSARSSAAIEADRLAEASGT